MPTPQTDGQTERSDADILEEIRERRTYGETAWANVREEGRKDTLCVAGQPWEALDPTGLEDRLKNGRPAIACDELGQYINQVGNDIRQNKRAVKATPKGNGANDKTAEFKSSLIRQIEYESNAQRDVYSPIFENCLTRSYGYGRVIAKRTHPLSRNMELRFEAFPNPDVVLPDPDGAMLAPDLSKIRWCFVIQPYKRKQFTRDFPDATVTDFSAENARIAPNWINGESLQVAEYWTVELRQRRVIFLKSQPDRGFYEETLAEQFGRPVADSEIDLDDMVEAPYVCHYLTNGLELLAKKGKPKKTHWPGTTIPIVSCYGKILYVPTSGGTERRIMSMPRLARDPYLLYCYTRTCQQEVIGSVPRATFVGYEGSDWRDRASASGATKLGPAPPKP